MSSGSSSESTQEEMTLTEVKIEPDSELESDDSHDPLSVEQTSTVTDKAELLYEPYADPVSLESSCDPLSPGEKTNPDVTEDPLSATHTKAKHDVPTLIGLLGKDVSLVGKQLVVPNPLSSEGETPNVKPTEDTGEEDTRGPRKYTCLRCGFITDLDNELRNHMHTLHPEALKDENPKKIHKDAVTKPWKCDLCNTYFPQVAMLEIHKEFQHPNPPSPERLSCGQCKFTTTIPSHLRKHQLKHPGKKQYSCKKCDYTCVYLSSFKRHSLTHTTGEKPYACNLCDYMAHEATNLRRHKKRKHGGRGPVATAVPKPESPDPPGDLRPVSVLLVLVKVLNQYCSSSRPYMKTMCEHQSCFRCGFSCTIALLRIAEEIQNVFSQSLVTINYTANAFDCVDHDSPLQIKRFFMNSIQLPVPS